MRPVTALFSALLVLFTTSLATFAGTSTDVFDGGLVYQMSDEALELDGSYFLILSDSEYGRELYLTDGSVFGTKIVQNINPSGSSNPDNGVMLNGSLIFSANDGTNGYELWISDGTDGGTTLLADINPSGHSYPTGLTLFDGKVYFGANDGTNGSELWVTDGTPSGTAILKDIESSGGSYPQNFFVFNNELFFCASTTATGYALFKTDGTSVGTELVQDFDGTSANTITELYAEVGSLMLFSADYWLAVSDGTTAGTYIMETGESERYAINSMQNCVYNGYYYFDRYIDEGSELWRSDGTDVGTTLVGVVPGEGIEEMVIVDNGMLLLVYTWEGQYLLYTSDGTTISYLSDLGDEEGESSYSNDFTVVDGIAYFTHTGDLASSGALWRSDGTVAGTYQVSNPDDDGGTTDDVVPCGDVILFSTSVSSVNTVYSWAAAPHKDLARTSWAMFGAPVAVTNGLCGLDLFANDFDGNAPNGSNWMLSRWDAANECYVRLNQLESDGSDLGDPDNVTPGLGYWIIQDVADDTKMKICDSQVDMMCTDTEPIMVTINNPSEDPVYRGLTMMANPFMQKYDVSHSVLWVNGSGEPLPISQAISMGACNANIYTWDTDLGQYVTTPLLEAVLDPWEGFWYEEILPAEGILFCFLPPMLYDNMYGGSGPSIAGDKTSHDLSETVGWTLDLPVRSVDGEYRDEYNRIGIGDLYQDAFDQYDASEFNPMGGHTVQAYFDHQNWSSKVKTFTFDLRNTDFNHGPKEWEYTVRTWRLGNRDFEIEWPGIASIPAEYQFTLIDNSTGDPVELDMRSQTSMRFQTGPHTGEYEYHTWTIRVEKTFVTDTPEIRLLPSSYEFQSPYPNPFNPTSMLTIALPEAGNLKVQVFNLLGQQVATLVDGKVDAGYQRLTFDGSKLASGTYLVRAEVPGKLNTTQKIQLVK